MKKEISKSFSTPTLNESSTVSPQARENSGVRNDENIGVRDHLNDAHDYPSASCNVPDESFSTTDDFSSVMGVLNLPSLNMATNLASKNSSKFIAELQSPSNIIDTSKTMEFPVTLKNNVAEMQLFEGLLSQNCHSIKLLQPGFYGLELTNQNEAAWDSLYLGIGRMKAVADFKIDHSENNPSSVEINNGNIYLSQPQEAFEIRNIENLSKNFRKKDGEALEFASENISRRNSSTKRSINGIQRVDSGTSNDALEALTNKDDYRAKQASFTYFYNSNKHKFSNTMSNIIKVAPLYFITNEVITQQGQVVARAQQTKIMYFYVSNSSCICKLHVYGSLTLGMRLKCKYKLYYCGLPRVNPSNVLIPFNQGIGILCLDGGGILGLSSLKILERLELKLQKKLCDPNARIADCFDMICGTSTGGLIALGLLRRLSIKEMIDNWALMSEQIFEGNRSLFSGIFFEGYDTTRLKNVLNKSLGYRFLNTYVKPYCFVTSTNVKHNPFELFLLRNYTHHHLASIEYRGFSSLPLWTAAWATSAAPTYLKGPNAEELQKMGFLIHPEVQLCDGALKANNPTIVALEEAARLAGKRLHHFIETDLDVLLSLGTGQPAARQTTEKTHTVSTFQILLNATHLLTSGTRVHREVLHWMNGHEDRYFRFNVPGVSNIHLDSCDKKSHDLLIKATNDYLTDEKYYDVHRLIHSLVRRKSRR